MVYKRILPIGKKVYHGFTLEEIYSLSQPLNSKQIMEVLARKAGSKQHEQWGNSLYVGYNESVPKGYLDHEYGKPGVIVELELIDNLDYVCSCHEIFANGECKGNFVPEDVKKEVEVLLGEPVTDNMFMDFLGNHNCAFECFCNLDHEIELIVPCKLLDKLKVLSVTSIRYDPKNYVYIQDPKQML